MLNQSTKFKVQLLDMFVRKTQTIQYDNTVQLHDLCVRVTQTIQQTQTIQKDDTDQLYDLPHYKSCLATVDNLICEWFVPNQSKKPKVQSLNKMC